MQKIVFILILIIISTGCSVNRIGRRIKQEPEISIPAGRLVESIIAQNVTNYGFFIEKAEIEVTGDEGTDRLNASVKFKPPGEYLISIRNKTGIEAVRAFVSNDTILVKDRIGRKQYCASPGYLGLNYGVSLAVLPLLFGDFIGRSLENNKITECLEGHVNIERFVKGLNINYLIDCGKGKSISAVGQSSVNKSGMEILYSEFFMKEDSWLPGKIEIRNLLIGSTIHIRIQKITIPWEGNIEFIPGNNYEIIELQ